MVNLIINTTICILNLLIHVLLLFSSSSRPPQAHSLHSSVFHNSSNCSDKIVRTVLRPGRFHNRDVCVCAHVWVKILVKTRA